MGLLALNAHADLCTGSGEFSAFQKKVKWRDAAKRAGLSANDGKLLFIKAEGHWDHCCEAWRSMRSTAATAVLQDLVTELGPVVVWFREHKRSTAVLDFDDLIYSARDLLRDHESVRQALARRYTHVLVDGSSTAFLAIRGTRAEVPAVYRPGKCAPSSGSSACQPTAPPSLPGGGRPESKGHHPAKTPRTRRARVGQRRPLPGPCSTVRRSRAKGLRRSDDGCLGRKGRLGAPGCP